VLDVAARECLNNSTSNRVVTALADKLEAVGGGLEPEVFSEVIKQVGQDTGVKGKDLYFPVRAAVTGNVHGPDIATVASIRGKNDVVAGLRKGAGLYDGTGG
jgi:nondiscriminating glutamyl-tRNA synthetase